MRGAADVVKWRRLRGESPVQKRVREGGMLPKVWLPVHRRGQRETWRQSLEEIEKNSFIIFARQKGYTAG